MIMEKIVLVEVRDKRKGKEVNYIMIFLRELQMVQQEQIIEVYMRMLKYIWGYS